MTNEQKAIEVGKDRKRLLKQLKETKAVLDRAYALLFSKNTYDFENQRLVSDSGRFALQWRVRHKPDQPESYENQQTNVGTVVLVQLTP